MIVEEVGLLRDLALVGAVGVAVVLLLTRIGIPPVAGFLVAGAFAGPHGFGLIPNVEEIARVAEVGVVLLLFTLGLELSLERIRFIWRPVLVGGTVQFFGTALLAYLILVGIGEQADRAILLGGAVALSSTAIVLRLLTDRGELDAPHGRFTTGVLIYQDLMVVPMTLLVPVLASGGSGDLRLAILVVVAKAVAVILVIGLIARFLFPMLFHLIDRTRAREVFILAVLTTGLGTAALVAEAGLSLALGAFIAGLILSGTDYGRRATSEVIPFRDAFMGVFFISLGMLFDPDVIGQDPVLVLLVFVGLLAGKAAVAALAALSMRYPARAAWRAGINLAQFGELGFVILTLGAAEGILDSRDVSVVVTAGALSMLASRLLMERAPSMRAGEVLLRPLERLLRVTGVDEPSAELDQLRDHVVVVGYGVAGQLAARVLRGASVRYVVLELDAERVRAARKAGEPVYFGDIASPETMRYLHLGQARALIMLVNDPDAARRALTAASAEFPTLPILLRTRQVSERKALQVLGAAHVVVEEQEGAVEMAANVLALLGVPFDAIRENVDAALTEGGQVSTQQWLSVPLE